MNKFSNLPFLIDVNVYSMICNEVWNNLASVFEKYTQQNKALDIYHKVYFKDLFIKQRIRVYSYEF
jgi:hypothetical protein